MIKTFCLGLYMFLPLCIIQPRYVLNHYLSYKYLSKIEILRKNMSQKHENMQSHHAQYVSPFQYNLM